MASASLTAHLSLPVPRGRTPFVPTVRGDLQGAAVSPQAFDEVALQAPRPVAFLVDRSLARVPGVTARDVALFEWCCTLAVHADPTLSELELTGNASVRQAGIALSGGGKPALPRDVAESLGRLFGGERQRLTVDGLFAFSLQPWVGELLRPGGQYGYLDHAVLARFRTKGGILLYRWLVGQIAAEQIRYKPRAAPVEFAADPRDLAFSMGMPGEFHSGLFRTRFLTPALAEIAEHVKTFEVVETREDKRIRPPGWEGNASRNKIAAVVLVVRMLPPKDTRVIAVRKRSKEQLETLTAYPDIPAYAVSTSTLMRLSSALPSNLQRGGLLGSEVHGMRQLWWSALHEALSGEVLTGGYSTRAYRSGALLAAIERDGPDAAFWGFAMEETDGPDLRPFLADKPRVAAQGNLSRRIRHKRHRAGQTNAGRRALREARRDGTAPAPVSRNSTVGAAVEHVEEPVEAADPAPVEAAPKVQEVPGLGRERTTLAFDAPVDEIARRLRNPALKLEAARVWAATQLGQDFPDVQAERTLNDVLQRFQWGDFPLLAELDASTGGGYLWLLKATQMMLAKKLPYLVGDKLQHAHALATRAWIAAVRNEITDLGTSNETTRVALQRDTARYRAEWKNGSRARDAARDARYRQPVPHCIDPAFMLAHQAKRAAKD
ncbi:hypothetical protein [Methylobacterium sp. 37f]|uniref:hypothetical protein n=1 Tax=Methylobacterium sp. 37f TaxID=2817058 RepID=UPI001FFCFE79|nr:hypothetical protein [Methylobacterium sp. 37f]MCK2055290.1 hypothetical protein [Methylobacterium sp. 37f]